MLTNTFEVLYTSAQVRDALAKIYHQRFTSGRRVAVVAYVGEDWAAYLPNARGLTLVCSPTPGATSAVAISELQAAGATVLFSDRLHMKVYWSEHGGCVIGSANLSTNAFGLDRLKEAAVRLEAKAVDIDQLLKEADARPPKPGELSRLAKDRERFKRAMAHLGQRPSSVRSFLEWHRLDPDIRPEWKLGWWMDNDLETAKAAKAVAKQKYGKSDVHECMNFAKGQYKPQDWLLCFELPQVRYASWMFVDFVVSVDRKDKGAFEKDYPFQAVQVHNARTLEPAPFVLDAIFRAGFKRAVRDYGVENIEKLPRLAVPQKLEQLIAQHIQSIDE